MTIHADKVKVSGPLADGGFNLTFSVGEYEREKVAEVLRIPPMIMIQLDINYDKEDTR